VAAVLVRQDCGGLWSKVYAMAVRGAAAADSGWVCTLLRRGDALVWCWVLLDVVVAFTRC
jgi:hypothetical protein